MKELKSAQHTKATEGIKITFREHAIMRHEERIFKGKRKVADAIPRGPYFDSASLEKQVRAGVVHLDDEDKKRE